MEETDVKGGYYLPLIARKLPNYKFIVVASRHSDSLPGMPKNIHLWGRAKTQEELSQLYSEADVTLLLSKRETFSMVTAESLCCGTPVVGFKAGGPESIAPPDKCIFVANADINGIANALSTMSSYKVDVGDMYDKTYMTNLFLHNYSK